MYFLYSFLFSSAHRMYLYTSCLLPRFFLGVTSLLSLCCFSFLRRHTYSYLFVNLLYYVLLLDVGVGRRRSR
ncbi:hypothetical protein R3P38DRAFT_2853689 [Favolaschia claudopus]|uniref:NADH dehydrogenase subunit 4L n=1 Tax=Favolaschia claudopus TaxID=2862362 RepID=A0AAW0DMM3_9AGAR